MLNLSITPPPALGKVVIKYQSQKKVLDLSKISIFILQTNYPPPDKKSCAPGYVMTTHFCLAYVG